MAADSNPEQMVRELSHDLMSPYCPGRTVAACTSKQARLLEDRMLEQAEAGMTRQQIEAQLIDEFGPQISGHAVSPTSVAIGLVVGLLALMVLISLGRRWSRASKRVADPRRVEADNPKGEDERVQPSKAELAALDDELDDLDAF